MNCEDRVRKSLLWMINPFTAIYAGYNGNRSNLEIVDVGNGPEVLPVGDDPDGTDGRQLFVKVSYLHRF